MDKQTLYLQRIRSVYPNLPIESACLNEAGQNNDILIVDDEVIFRFPKYEAAIKRLETEAAILRGIQPYVTLSVPNPIYRSLDAETVGAAFVGYKMIGGEPLWPEILWGMAEDARRTLAVQLAAFLRELHSVPVKEAISVDLPIQDGREEWADMYARIREKLFPQMRPDAHEQVAKNFETFLNDSLSSAYEPVLRHGDFGPSNILFDPKSRTVTGIIDFGSAGLGDPAVDLAGILIYGEPFIGFAARTYPVAESTLERARFYRSTFALQEALFGVENDSPEAFANGIKSYL